MSKQPKQETIETESKEELTEVLPTFIAENPENEDGDVEFLCCSHSSSSSGGGVLC